MTSEQRPHAQPLLLGGGRPASSKSASSSSRSTELFGDHHAFPVRELIPTILHNKGRRGLFGEPGAGSRPASGPLRASSDRHLPSRLVLGPGQLFGRLEDVVIDIECRSQGISFATRTSSSSISCCKRLIISLVTIAAARAQYRKPILEDEGLISPSRLGSSCTGFLSGLVGKDLAGRLVLSFRSSLAAWRMSSSMSSVVRMHLMLAHLMR